VLRTLVVVCLTIGAALAAGDGLVAVPTEGWVSRPGPAQHEPAPPARAPVPGSPNALWLQFDRMTAAERKNAELSLQPSSAAQPGAWDESREICRLWNRGECDAALNRLRGYYRFDDPCRVTVAVSWRTPIAVPRSFSGPDVRIGTYDSIHDLMLDRGANGYLYAGMPCEDSTRTRIAFCRSTDNGSSWQATSSVSWGTNNFLSAWSAACHGSYYQVSWTTLDYPQRAWCGRKSMSTGSWVLFPGDSLCVIGFEAASGDTIEELSECTQEDASPGWRVYLFGRTKSQLLYFSWTDSSCRAWRHHSTNGATCSNGLDCTFNEGYAERYLWASWIRYVGADTANLAFGYMTTADTSFHWSWFSAIDCWRSVFDPTSITAWRDTIMIVATTPDNPRQVAGVLSNDAGTGTWYAVYLAADPTYSRELPELSMREGGGLAAAYRAYGAGGDRWVLAQHADTAGRTLSPADTANEAAHRPSNTSHIRIVPLGGGSYGVGWINYVDSIYYGAWFSTYTPSGIAERPAAAPLPLSFRALLCRGGANLCFENPVTGQVRLRIFDGAGRLVRADRRLLPAGRQTIDFRAPSSGVYIAVLQAAGRTASTRFAAVK